MATDQRRRVRKVEAAVLGAVDVAREWFEEVRRWGSFVEYARAQAREPDAPDDATRIARRVHAGLAGHGRADVGRVVVDSLFLRELLVELDRLVLEATDRLGVRLRLLILGRAGWRPGDHGGRSWDWVAGELVGEARRIDRVIATVAQELGGTDVVLPTTAEAWKPVRDCADTVAAWLPVPSGRVRTRHARRAEYEFRALVDRCRASVLDSLGYSELARRILRYGLLGFDGSASHGHRLAGGVSADGRWLVFTAEQVRKYLPPPWGEAPAVAYADYRAAEAGDPEDDEGQDQDGMEGVDEKADG